MGEMLVKIGDNGPDPAWRDGDSLLGFTDREIHYCNASKLCHVRHHPFNRDGLNILGGISEKFQARLYRYKFERVSRTEWKRTDQVTSEEIIIGLTPNADGLYCNVEEYLARRIRHKHHKIFGTKGKEVMYEGPKDQTQANIDNIGS